MIEECAMHRNTLIEATQLCDKIDRFKYIVKMLESNDVRVGISRYAKDEGVTDVRREWLYVDELGTLIKDIDTDYKKGFLVVAKKKLDEAQKKFDSL